MSAFVVVENPRNWPLDLPAAPIISARDYLVEPRFAEMRRATIFNLCRSYRYQTAGYYVSLLAAARGHKPLPSVDTIQDLRISPVLRILSMDLVDLIQRDLGALRSDAFELSIYFGRNVAKRYERLSQALFNQFPAPFLRANFERQGRRWRLANLRAIGAADIPDPHREFVIARATEYFARPPRPPRARQDYRYDLAILWNPADENAPSDDRAIRRFVQAAQAEGIEAMVISQDDYGRIAEFDALFIRETTAVNHHTYRFARRASVAGLVVIDDPQSILRCTNKVYQAEMFAKNAIPHPRTVIVHKETPLDVVASVGFPCVLKQPDSAFSRGVIKVEQVDGLRGHVEMLLEASDLVIAQEYAPSGFDWRVGVLNRRPLFVCKYHMARGHWQIVRTTAHGQQRYGKVECVPLDVAPKAVVDIGTRAASLIGDGLYGVDIKEVDGRFLVTEVNDNPNIEAGYEDGVLKDELYGTIMRHFRERLDARGAQKTV